MAFIALALGLAAASTGDRATALATRLVEEVGPRPAGSEGADAAQRWVMEEIEARGWVPRRDAYGAWSTVWACRRGQSARVVLFLAHTDSVHAAVPGAHDNASSVAVLLTAMEDRIPAKPRRTVCFAFPDAEELGLLGAEGFAVRAADQGMLGGPIDQVMALEMVGAGRIVHNGLGTPWDGPRLKELLRVAPAEVPWMYRGVSWALPHMERSDHRPFADRGIPASMLLGRPDANVLWAYHTEADRPETLQPETLGAAVKAVRHVARARPLPSPGAPDPAVALFGWVLPGWILQGALGLGALASVLSLREVDRTLPKALGQWLVVSGAFASAVALAGAGRPLHAALVEPTWLAGLLAAAMAAWAWPWPASGGSGRALGGLYGLLALAITPWAGVVLAAPLAVASMAAILATRAPSPWFRGLLTLLAAWPMLHLVRPAALRELAFHGLYPAAALPWGLLVCILSLPVVVALQGRALPRRRGPALGALLVGVGVALVWSWSSPVHDDTFPPRVQRWAGGP